MAASSYLRPSLFFRLAPLLLGLAVAYAVSGVMGGRGGVSVGGDAAPMAEPGGSRTAGRHAAILKRNVLGLFIPPTDEEAARKAQGPGPGDPESWEISGILIGARSMALVTVDGKTEQVFPGDVINGWQLTQLREDSLIWDKGGRQVTVFLWTLDGKAEELKAAKSAEVYYPGAEEGTFEISSTEAVNVLKDPAWLLQQALYKPHLADGKIDGFTISNIQPNSILNNIGFRNGDIMKRINGETINGPQALMQMYSGLPKAQSLSIDVERDGSIKNLLIVLK
ncbi:MAG: hypothetical protein AB7E47_10250 [Desulfovibrionaceae bacterium]